MKVRYTGIVLTKESRRKLLSDVAHLLQPLLEAGWVMHNSPPAHMEPENLPHHMTICLGELASDRKHLVGIEQEMVATHWGHNDKAMAVKVWSNVKSANDTPHITVAVSPTGKPFHSNSITEWAELDNEIKLKGVVQEVV